MGDQAHTVSLDRDDVSALFTAVLDEHFTADHGEPSTDRTSRPSNTGSTGSTGSTGNTGTTHDRHSDKHSQGDPS